MTKKRSLCIVRAYDFLVNYPLPCSESLVFFFALYPNLYYRADKQACAERILANGKEKVRCRITTMRMRITA